MMGEIRKIRGNNKELHRVGKMNKGNNKESGSWKVM